MSAIIVWLLCGCCVWLLRVVAACGCCVVAAWVVAWLLGGCWVGCWVAACGCCVGCFVVAAWVVAQAAVWLLCVAWQIGWAASPFELSNYRIIESSISRILDFSNPRSLDPLDLSNHRFLDP